MSFGELQGRWKRWQIKSFSDGKTMRRWFWIGSGNSLGVTQLWLSGDTTYIDISSNTFKCGSAPISFNQAKNAKIG